MRFCFPPPFTCFAREELAVIFVAFLAYDLYEAWILLRLWFGRWPRLMSAKGEGLCDSITTTLQVKSGNLVLRKGVLFYCVVRYHTVASFSKMQPTWRLSMTLSCVVVIIVYNMVHVVCGVHHGPPRGRSLPGSFPAVSVGIVLRFFLMPPFRFL